MRISKIFKFGIVEYAVLYNKFIRLLFLWFQEYVTYGNIALYINVYTLSVYTVSYAVYFNYVHNDSNAGKEFFLIVCLYYSLSLKLLQLHLYSLNVRKIVEVLKGRALNWYR